MLKTSFTRQLNPLSLALLGVVAAILSYQAGANRPQTGAGGAGGAPALIATFDLEKTFEALDEWKAAKTELDGLAQTMKKETEAAANELKRMDKDLDDLQVGTAKYNELTKEMSQKTYEYQALVDFFRAKMEIRRGRALKNVYLSIRAAAEQMSKERGFMVVFVDDSIAPIPPGTEEEMMRQISARRMVYTSPQVDVTDELISRMNNAFKMAGPKP